MHPMPIIEASKSFGFDSVEKRVITRSSGFVGNLASSFRSNAAQALSLLLTVWCPSGFLANFRMVFLRPAEKAPTFS